MQYLQFKFIGLYSIDSIYAYNRRDGNIKRSYRYILQTDHNNNQNNMQPQIYHAMIKEIQLWAYSLW